MPRKYPDGTEPMVHVIGQLVGARDFPTESLFCRWEMVTEGAWKVRAGSTKGQTQVATSGGYHDLCCWCHPIDISYSTRGLQGWPTLIVQVWHHDTFGRNQIYSYGLVRVPTSPGSHSVVCPTWSPAMTMAEKFSQRFGIGGGARLRDPSSVLSAASNIKGKMTTESMGSVHLNLGIIFRNMDIFGLEC